MKYQYWTCDVFTERRFGGNPLAVLPYADGLSEPQMQQIAREFNFSETAFVFPSKAPHTRSVRIFTPAREVPFAGHPNVGTAFVLASIGEFGEIRSSLSVTFEENAGLVPVTIREAGGRITACERARVNLSGFEAILREDIRPSIYLYTRDTDGFDLRARMFAPLSGVPEDPATGSASCAVAGLLAHFNKNPSGGFRWRIAQGVEMGRPSTLLARAEKKGGLVRTTWVGGGCVLVGEGFIQVD